MKNGSMNQAATNAVKSILHYIKSIGWKRSKQPQVQLPGTSSTFKRNQPNRQKGIQFDIIKILKHSRGRRFASFWIFSLVATFAVFVQLEIITIVEAKWLMIITAFINLFILVLSVPPSYPLINKIIDLTISIGLIIASIIILAAEYTSVEYVKVAPSVTSTPATLTQSPNFVVIPTAFTPTGSSAANLVPTRTAEPTPSPSPTVDCSGVIVSPDLYIDDFGSGGLTLRPDPSLKIYNLSMDANIQDNLTGHAVLYSKSSSKKLASLPSGCVCTWTSSIMDTDATSKNGAEECGFYIGKISKASGIIKLMLYINDNPVKIYNLQINK